MTDEEFYKSKVIELLNKLEWLCLDGFDAKADSDGKVIDIKRRLIIKEKTWYKISNIIWKFAYIVGKNPYENKWEGHVYRGEHHLNISDSVPNKWDIFGKDSDGDTLTTECTPEEVKEIEDKLRGKNEEPN